MAKELTTFRIQGDALAKLKKAAKEEGRTVSNLVQLAVKEFLERRPSKPAGTGKPSCQDFIIAAIRRLRHKPTPSGARGVPLWRIYSVAMEVYTEQEFRESLAVLLKRGEVVMITRGTVEEVLANGACNYKYEGDRRVFAICDHTPLGSEISIRRPLLLDMQGQPVGENDPGVRESIAGIRLYVKADGLPENIAKFLLPDCRGRITAQDIIESMRG